MQNISVAKIFITIFESDCGAQAQKTRFSWNKVNFKFKPLLFRTWVDKIVIFGSPNFRKRDANLVVQKGTRSSSYHKTTMHPPHAKFYSRLTIRVICSILFGSRWKTCYTCLRLGALKRINQVMLFPVHDWWKIRSRNNFGHT